MCGAAGRRDSGHDEENNDRNVRETGREKRTKTQYKISEMLRCCDISSQFAA